MHDKIIDIDNEENSKSKKIRRILLIKTDEELKKMIKRSSNVMINSKTSEEINKSYDLYNILLSEKTKIYFNFIKTEEKIFPINNNNVKIAHSTRLLSKTKNIELQNKISDTTFEDDLSPRSPKLNFFPMKIDLGCRKFNIPKRKTDHFFILNGILEDDKTTPFENQLSSNGNPLNSNEKQLNSKGKIVDSKLDSSGKTINSNRKIIDSNGDILNTTGTKLNKSTRVQKKRLYKLVDKIMYIKMNEYIEKIIKKNIKKLRKYCNKLKFHKLEIKKQNKIKTQNEPNDKNTKPQKRLTLTNNKNFLKKSLFGSIDKIIEPKNIKKPEGRLKSTKFLNLSKKDLQFKNLKEKKKEEEDEEDFVNKIISSKQITKVLTIHKVKKIEVSNKKKKFRKMQTLNGNFKNQQIESNIKKKIKFTKNSEKIKNPGEYTGKNANQIFDFSTSHFLSTKFDLSSKYQFNNSNIKEQQKSKFCSLFGKINQKELSKKEKKESVQYFLNSNKKKKEKIKSSNQKDKKNKKNVYNKCLHYSKKDEIFDLLNFDKKGGGDKKGVNISSDFNNKRKKSVESPIRKKIIINRNNL